MNRRGFLGLLGGAAAVALIGELPSSRTFFLAPAGGWRPDDLNAALRARHFVEAMAKSMQFTKETVAAHLLNNGFSAVRINCRTFEYTDVTRSVHVPVDWPHVTKSQDVVLVGLGDH